MSFAQIVWQERDPIIGIAQHAIIRGMRTVWERCNKPQEPDFVAGLVLESTRILYHEYSDFFARYGIGFSLASVFCHQTPKVRYPHMKQTSCEVGDLLLVHVHTPRQGVVTRNALLYQAKVSSKQPYRVAANEADQLQLYTEWPLFEYYRSRPLTGNVDVVPKLRHTGAQYMLIDDRPPEDPLSGLSGIPGTYPIGSCMAGKYLHDHNDLATEIHYFLHLHSGREFTDGADPGGLDGWSKLVWDLLRTGLVKAFNRRNSGLSGTPRYSGGPLSLLDGGCFARSMHPRVCATVRSVLGHDHWGTLFDDAGEAPPDEEMPRDADRPSESGVSVILMESAEAQEE